MQNTNPTAGVGDAKFEEDKKLEGIFLPHARQRRDAIQPSSPEGWARFIHYTSAESALKIIRQKNIWMRSAACMADYREVQHGFSMLRSFFSQAEKINKFTEAIDKIAPGAAKKALDNFDQWWKHGTIQFKTFITSVSVHTQDEDRHGRLSMWRAFGGNTARVGLVFQLPRKSDGAEAMRLIFNPVNYMEDSEADSLILPVIENIPPNLDFLKSLPNQRIQDWIFYMLLINVTCTKHIGFREEQEWRVVHNPNLHPTSLIKPSTETISGVPQIVYNILLDKDKNQGIGDLDFSKLFERLIIGPSPYPATMYDAFFEELTKAEVLNPGNKIFISNIPIRSS